MNWERFKARHIRLSAEILQVKRGIQELIGEDLLEPNNESNPIVETHPFQVSVVLCKEILAYLRQHSHGARDLVLILWLQNEILEIRNAAEPLHSVSVGDRSIYIIANIGNLRSVFASLGSELPNPVCEEFTGEAETRDKVDQLIKEKALTEWQSSRASQLRTHVTSHLDLDKEATKKHFHKAKAMKRQRDILRQHRNEKFLNEMKEELNAQSAKREAIRDRHIYYNTSGTRDRNAERSKEFLAKRRKNNRSIRGKPKKDDTPPEAGSTTRNVSAFQALLRRFNIQRLQ